MINFTRVCIKCRKEKPILFANAKGWELCYSSPICPECAVKEGILCRGVGLTDYSSKGGCYHCGTPKPLFVSAKGWEVKDSYPICPLCASKHKSWLRSVTDA